MYEEMLPLVLTPATLKALVGISIVTVILIISQCAVNHRIIKLMQLMAKTSKLGTLYRRHMNIVKNNASADAEVVQKALYRLCHEIEHNPDKAKEFANTICSRAKKLNDGDVVGVNIIHNAYVKTFGDIMYDLSPNGCDYDSMTSIVSAREASLNQSLADIGTHTKELTLMVKKFKRLKPAHAEIINTTIKESDAYVYDTKNSGLVMSTYKWSPVNTSNASAPQSTIITNQIKEDETVTPCYTTIDELLCAIELITTSELYCRVAEMLRTYPSNDVPVFSVTRDGKVYTSDTEGNLYLPLNITQQDVYLTKGSYSYVYTKEGCFTVVTSKGLKVITKTHKIRELRDILGISENGLTDIVTEAFDIVNKSDYATATDAPAITAMEEYIPTNGKFEEAPKPDPIDPDAPTITGLTE